MSINLAAYLPVQVVVAGKAFTYKFLPDADTGLVTLIPRDAVVVDFGSKGLTVGIVESINQVPVDPNAKFKYKWIVGKVDRTLYDQILAAETAAAGSTDPMAEFRGR